MSATLAHAARSAMSRANASAMPPAARIDATVSAAGKIRVRLRREPLGRLIE
jgi:hypothetical protein